MITLLLDTSTKYLNIGILKDENCVVNYSIEANKIQSEITMSTLEKLFNQNQLDPSSIEKLVITKGPGSYTGIRIAMTIAKVIASIKPAKLYTLNTLLAMLGKKTGLAILDARANRAYYATYHDGEEISAPQVGLIKNINYDGQYIYGDAHLINKDSQSIDLIQNMIDLKEHWELVEDVDALTPFYLKENDSYASNH